MTVIVSDVSDKDLIHVVAERWYNSSRVQNAEGMRYGYSNSAVAIYLVVVKNEYDEHAKPKMPFRIYLITFRTYKCCHMFHNYFY